MISIIIPRRIPPGDYEILNLEERAKANPFC